MTEYGFCECGCGEKTTIAIQTDRRRGWVQGEPVRFRWGHRAKTGTGHPSWKGGRRLHGQGYVLVYCPDHPRAIKNVILEHILVAEKALGKPLPKGAVVHHVNENRADNRPCNLVVCEGRGYHGLLHRRMEERKNRQTMESP